MEISTEGFNGIKMVKKTEEAKEEPKSNKKSTANLMAKLLKLDGAVKYEENPFLNGVRSSSPSVNFTFGNTQLLPFGSSLVLFGPEKSGKTILTYDMSGKLHQDDPEAIVVKFNTEYREAYQLTPAYMKVWGIDQNRYIAYDANQPELIFDRIQNEIAAMCDEGLKIKFIIIDSISGIQGRRDANAESISTQQIGDHALTIGSGLKRILPVIKKHKIALALTTQVRAELDPIEQRRHKTVKMQAPWALRHFGDYFLLVQKDQSKEGRTDLLENELVNEALTDIKGNSEVTGHKIKVFMEDSSFGPKKRTGEFLFDYKKGIVNTHEEVFLLGTGRGIIEKPNNMTYVYKNSKWAGKEATLEAIKTDFELYEAILKDIKMLDV